MKIRLQANAQLLISNPGQMVATVNLVSPYTSYLIKTDHIATKIKVEWVYKPLNTPTSIAAFKIPDQELPNESFCPAHFITPFNLMNTFEPE